MNIVNDQILTKWLGDTLEEMHLQQHFHHVENKCFHCGLPNRFPLMVRDSDIKLFNEVMKSAYAVLDRHGITALLLSEIKAEITIQRILKNINDNP